MIDIVRDYTAISRGSAQAVRARVADVVLAGTRRIIGWGQPSGAGLPHHDEPSVLAGLARGAPGPRGDGAGRVRPDGRAAGPRPGSRAGCPAQPGRVDRAPRRRAQGGSVTEAQVAASVPSAGPARRGLRARVRPACRRCAVPARRARRPPTGRAGGGLRRHPSAAGRGAGRSRQPGVGPSDGSTAGLRGLPGSARGVRVVRRTFRCAPCLSLRPPPREPLAAGGPIRQA